jgi:hypothetical protein
MIAEMILKLQQGEALCLVYEDRHWHLLKEKDTYIVSSSVNMVRMPFDDLLEALSYLLLHAGVWVAPS